MILFKVFLLKKNFYFNFKFMQNLFIKMVEASCNKQENLKKGVLTHNIKFN